MKRKMQVPGASGAVDAMCRASRRNLRPVVEISVMDRSTRSWVPTALLAILFPVAAATRMPSDGGLLAVGIPAVGAMVLAFLAGINFARSRA